MIPSENYCLPPNGYSDIKPPSGGHKTNQLWLFERSGCHPKSIHRRFLKTILLLVLLLVVPPPLSLFGEGGSTFSSPYQMISGRAERTDTKPICTMSWLRRIKIYILSCRMKSRASSLPECPVQRVHHCATNPPLSKMETPGKCYIKIKAIEDHFVVRSITKE